MEIAQGIKIIGNGWVVKPKGFRVRYQKHVGSKLVTEYSPGLEDATLDSDVTAWRYAWKLFMATQTQSGEITEDELLNITVVDDLNNPVIYYVTGEKEIFNLKDG